MRRFKTDLYWLLCCGYVLLYMAACTPTQPGSTLTRHQETARQPTPQVLPAGKHALAIFPWSITGTFEDVIFAEPEALRALKTGLGQTDFIPTYSYYSLEATQSQRLTRKDFPQLRRVWRGKNPNVETIVRLGAELGVKAVFMYDIDVSFGTDELRVYLVDIASHKIYEAEAETWDFAEESYSALLGLAQEVFMSYNRDRTQNRT